MALSAGQHVTLEIADAAFGGEGVARLDDFVVFVPFVAPGELVEAKISEVKKRFARASLVKVLRPSPHRATPPCPYFTQCGGCQYQHLDYLHQLQIKQKQIRDLFQRIGGLDSQIVDPVIPCPSPYGYRNRIMVRSQWDKFKQGLNLGFIRADSRLVVDISECKIAEPALNEQLQKLRANPPPKGGLKVVLRIPPRDWIVPPDSFFQNNFHLLPKMLEVVRSRLVEANTRHLVDVYCGVGFFGIELALSVHSFAGVEYDRMAIKAARQNAAQRNVQNGEFIADTAEAALPALLSRFTPEATSVILDPPRKGCQPQTLEMLRLIRPAQIIYVSCQPATMARDLNILTVDNVYKLTRLTPLDMFPQTSHVECVADLRSFTGPKPAMDAANPSA